MQQNSYEQLQLLFNPAPLLIYKPSMRDAEKGSAAKLHCSLRPEFNDGWLTKDVKGGVFLEIAPQTGFDKNENASFAWASPGEPNRIVTKLGLVDLQSIAYAYSQVRDKGAEIPENMRAKKLPDAWTKYHPVSLELFHKFDESTTIITFMLTERGTLLTISKGPKNRRSISMSLVEEMSFRKYIDHAFWAALMVGER